MGLSHNFFHQKKEQGFVGPSKRLRASDSGQAVIEYVLIMIAVVSFLIAIWAPLQIGLNSFVGTYSSYIRCLMVTGSPPGFGVYIQACEERGIALAANLSNISNLSKNSKENKSKDSAVENNKKSKAGSPSASSRSRNLKAVGSNSSPGSRSLSSKGALSKSESTDGAYGEKKKLKSQKRLRSSGSKGRRLGGSLGEDEKSEGESYGGVISTVQITKESPVLETKDLLTGKSKKKKPLATAVVRKKTSKKLESPKVSAGKKSSVSLDLTKMSWSSWVRYVVIGFILILVFFVIGSQLKTIRKSVKAT